MDIRLPIPKNWQDFENICHRLWREIWNDISTQKNGRQGQSQHGVDIFGKPIYTLRYSGVQCKDKDNRLGSILTTTELEAECNKALKFKPSVASYTIATTSERDQRVQEFYRELNENSSFPFDISVWSWEDIESEICYRPSILQHFYPNAFVSDQYSSRVVLSRYSTKDNFYAFFSRPALKDKISIEFRNFLLPLLYELTDNAYLHGKATRFEVRIENTRIELIDDGIPYDPLLNIDAGKASSIGHIGSFVLHTFLDKFSKTIKATYVRKNMSNELSFIFDEKLLGLNESSYQEINIDFRPAFGRLAALQIASNIVLEKSETIINVSELSNLSVFVEFIRIILNRLTEKQTLVLCIPRHEYFVLIHNWFNNDERLTLKLR